MSRQIDHNKPLSEEDRQYLLARGRGNEIVQNDLNHGKAREMSDEEIAEAERQQIVEAKGKTTPSLMDNSLIAEQHEQRKQDEYDQLTTYADMTYADGYDPDDVNFVQSLSDEELRDHLQERELEVSGTRPEMQKRLLDDINAPLEEDDGAGEDESAVSADEYDDEAKWSYSDLQAEAKKRQLAANGSRPELVARLRNDDQK